MYVQKFNNQGSQEAEDAGEGQVVDNGNLDEENHGQMVQEQEEDQNQEDEIQDGVAA